jgi:hypothetical protein
MKHSVLLWSLLAAHALALTPEQQQVPLEAASPDPKLAKVVLLAGSVSNKAGQHEYFAGCALLRQWLLAETGVWPTIVAGGWPQDERIFDGARAVVIYADGGEKTPFLAPERWSRIERLVQAGAGLVMLHQAVEVPAEKADALRGWLGAVWQPDIGSRGHWDMEFTKLPAHPILRGVTPFAAPLDGWLFNLHFAEKATPLLAGPVPEKNRTTPDAKVHSGREEVMAWSYERPGGGRSFAFTGCDLHRNWGVESQRRFVVNGILWAAGLEVPANGAKVPLDPADLAKWWDDKPKPAPKVKPIPASGQ